MADKITTMQSNSDGSYDFGFLFDNGAGITGETVGNGATYGVMCTSI